MHKHVAVPSPVTAVAPCFSVAGGRAAAFPKEETHTPRQKKTPAALIPTPN